MAAESVHTFAVKATTYVVVFPASILMARVLGPVGRGEYQVPVTITTITVSVASLGLAQALLRLWSVDVRRQLLTAATMLAIAIGPIAVICALVSYEVGASSTFDGVDRVLVIMAVLTVPFQLHSGIVSSYLNLRGSLRRANLAVAGSSIGQAAVTVVLVLLDLLTVHRVILVYAWGAILQWVLMARSIRIRADFVFPVDWSLSARLLRIGLVVQPYLIAQMMLLRIDVLFLARYEGLDSVGLYAVAVTLTETIWILTDSIPMALVHRAGNAAADSALSSTATAVRVNLLLALGSAVGMAAAAPLFIGLAYGDDFRPSIGLVHVLLPAVVFMALWRPVTPVLLRFAAPWMQSVVMGAALVVNAGLNVALIPRIGTVGAAISSVLAYGWGAVIALAWLRRSGRLRVTDLLPARDDFAVLWRFANRLRERTTSSDA